VTHRIHVSLVVAVLVAVAALASPVAAKKPNILWLHADDQRPDTIRALGNPAIITPTLDALATRGMSFRNAYNFGGNSPAVCTPSRNMMLSGRSYFGYSRMENSKTGETFRPDAADRMAAVTIEAKLKAGFRWNIFAPGDGPNVPVSLAAAGYQTYHHGKKGNTATQIQARFEINKYLENDQQERLSGEPGKEIVDAAVEFLAGRKDERPFAMYLAFGNPHDPRVVAPEYLAKYDRPKIPLPANYRPTHPFNNGELTVRDERLAPWPRTEDEVRKQLHEYYAVITAFDFHLGRLLKSLAERGLADDTIVVFSADQGLAVGSHGLMGKQNLYDHSTKLPLVLAGPGIKPGSSDSLVYLFDVYPTLCELVGAETPAGIDGRSFAGVLSGRTEKHRDVVFAAYQNVQRMVRDDRWKLIRYPQVDRTQLFDIMADPHEIKNLADDIEQADRVKSMLAVMKTEQQHYGDWLPLKVAHPQPAKFDFNNVPPASPPKKK
jgi:arylsulfatase A-like enzyme